MGAVCFVFSAMHSPCCIPFDAHNVLTLTRLFVDTHRGPGQAIRTNNYATPGHAVRSAPIPPQRSGTTTRPPTVYVTASSNSENFSKPAADNTYLQPVLNTHYYSSLQEPTRPVSTVYVQPGQVVGGRATQAADQHYYSELKDPPERPVRGCTPQFVSIVRFTIASVTIAHPLPHESV